MLYGLETWHLDSQVGDRGWDGDLGKGTPVTYVSTPLLAFLGKFNQVWVRLLVSQGKICLLEFPHFPIF